MSDGNYNRNLLPYNNSQSGVRAGKSALRQVAVNELRRQPPELCPDIPEAEMERRMGQMRDALK